MKNEIMKNLANYKVNLGAIITAIIIIIIMNAYNNKVSDESKYISDYINQIQGKISKQKVDIMLYKHFRRNIINLNNYFTTACDDFISYNYKVRRNDKLLTMNIQAENDVMVYSFIEELLHNHGIFFVIDRLQLTNTKDEEVKAIITMRYYDNV